MGLAMQGNEKRINDVKVRFEDSLYIEISKLADMDERTVADYLHLIVSMHVRGHGSRLSLIGDRRKSSNRDS